MKKQGHYTKRWGGSKSGYQKGVMDTLKVLGVGLLSVVSIAVAVLSTKKK